MVTVAVTGATGSFGSAFVEYLLRHTDFHILGISRADGRQEALLQHIRNTMDPAPGRVKFVPCDVTDPIALDAVFAQNMRPLWIVHAAALKRVTLSYEFPQEYARIIIDGTANVARVASKCADKLLLISTDKACQAHNPYGAMKRVAEAITLSTAGVMGSVVRGPNIWGSDGSVMRLWANAIKQGRPCILTGMPFTTRFLLSMEDWVAFVRMCLGKMTGGETFAPRCSGITLQMLENSFRRVYPHAEFIHTDSLRVGDKNHEYLISPVEAQYTASYPWGYVMDPSGAWEGDLIHPIGVASDVAGWWSNDDLDELVRQL